jgi:hypothetical protein
MINDDNFLMTEDEIETAFQSGNNETILEACVGLKARVDGGETSVKSALRMMNQMPFDIIDIPVGYPVTDFIYSTLSAMAKRADDTEAKEIVRLYGKSLHECYHYDITLACLNGGLAEVAEAHPNVIPDTFEIMEAESSMKAVDSAAMEAANELYGVIMEKGSLDDAERAMQMLKHNVETPEIPGMMTQAAACKAVARGVAAKSVLAKDGMDIIMAAEDNLERWNSYFGENEVKALKTIMENGTRNDAAAAMEVFAENLSFGIVPTSEACQVLIKGAERSVPMQLGTLDSKVANELLNDMSELVSKFGDSYNGSDAAAFLTVFDSCVAKADLQMVNKAARTIRGCMPEVMAKQSHRENVELLTHTIETVNKGLKAHPELKRYSRDVALDLYLIAPGYACTHFLEDMIGKGTSEDFLKITAVVSGELARDRNSSMAIEKSLDTLSKGLEAHPELARNVLTATQLALTSENLTDCSLWAAYGALGKVAKADPSLAIDVVDAVKKGMQNKENSGGSLKAARKVLEEVAKDNPQVLEHIRRATGKGLSDEAVHITAYKQEDTEQQPTEKGVKNAKSPEVLSAFMQKNAKQNGLV